VLAARQARGHERRLCRGDEAGAPAGGAMSTLPPVYAVCRITDNRWEVVGSDDDPRWPPWRRWGAITRRAQPNPGQRPGFGARRPVRAIGRKAPRW
jgi:hypothetical protein